MPYYKNGPIQNRVNSLNFVDLKTTIKVIIDILRDLEYLHENGYYHCDIKPNNILIGDNEEYILSDYRITCFSPTHTAVKPRQIYLPHAAPETVQCTIYDPIVGGRGCVGALITISDTFRLSF
jgi:serine/threonine protein kinase